MENISRENIKDKLKTISTEETSTKVEITTFDFETIEGVVSNFKIGEYNEAIIMIEDNGTINEIEIDFIRDLIICD